MRSKPFQLLGGSDFNMTRMVKLIGTTLVAATLAALTGLLVAGGQSLVLAQANTPATGAPVIEGAAQLDERMLARTSGRISDADGMTNSRFSYQWISNDGTTDTDIEGATSSSYTIVAADAGKTIKVRVSFTDDAGNPEALTSAPTGVVSGQRNSPTMGLPTIGGTAKVGQKLTVNTSGIADADGLTNASYGGTWSAGGGYLRALIGQGNDLSYTVSRRDVGMTLDMTVNFKDDAGKSILLTSAPTAVVVATSPAAPENFDVSQNSDGDLELSWEEPTWDLGGEIGGEKTWGDGGSAITGYVVQWKEAADRWDTVGDVSEATVTGITHTIEGLTDGVAYTIKVIAVNDVGRGASSDEATATINLPVSPPLSTDATLSALTLSGIGFGTFDSTTTSYTAQVANSVSQTTVTPTVNDSGASYVIKLGGVTDADGVLALRVGSNVITVEVTAEDGNAARTYTVTVTRAAPPSTDAALSALTLNGIDFGTFDSTTASYTATVANSVSQTTVTPTVSDSGASYVIKLGGVTAADGVISLAVGSNVITIEVTAEDGETSLTYTITVTRGAPPSTDAALSALTLSGVDFGTFSSGTTSYTAQVAHSMSQTTVTPALSDSRASYVIKLSGVEDADGVIPLTVGNNVITVEVTAEDGNTARTYTLTVTRTAASTDATLSALTLSGIDFGTFASGRTSYSVQVANSVSQTTVTPTVSDSGASYAMKLGGVEDADGVIALSVGSNVISVEVTAENDSTTRTYTVTVTRAEPATPEHLSSDATLTALTLSGIDFGTFDSTTASYTAAVANSVSQTTVNPTVNHSGASYVIKLGGVTDADAVVSLSVGSNVITVEVTAEDDNAARTYTVTVTSRCAALDRRNPQRPVAERGRLRDIRLDNRLIHSHRRQQRISDDGQSDREPLRGELRHQARRSDGRRR